MDVGNRIKQRRKQLKMSAEKLGEVIGKNRATIYRYESGEIENMPIEALEPIAKALNVSPAYLMGWEENDRKEIMSEYLYIPRSISAGEPLHVEALGGKDTKFIKIPDVLMGKWAGSGEVYILEVNGESMNNIIPHGSMIAVREIYRIDDLKDGDIVLYSEDFCYSIKRFYRRGKDFLFRPDSSDDNFFDKLVSADCPDLKIYGKVVSYFINLD